MPVKVLVVGGGRMGGALVSGLLASGFSTVSDIGVVEPSVERRAELAAAHDGLAVVEHPEAASVSPEGGAVLAVKPNLAESTCAALGVTGARRVLSIAAGVPTERLEAVLPPGTAVVRAMPNTPVVVGAGVSVISAGARASSGDLDWAEGVLSAVGKVIRLPEQQLHAVTGLSGSGPAYVFLVTEALIEAGIAAGLSPAVSRELVAGTLLGSARLLVESGEAPEALRADITSPGGTTVAGLGVLEERSVRAAFVAAVAAATERSRELGR